MSSIQPFLIALKDENSYVRARAVRALGKIGTEAVVTALFDALNHHQDERVRGWAAWALGQIGTEAVVTRLIGSLNHQIPQVRIWGTWALGQIRSPQAVAGLIGALKHEDSQVRWRAASALGFCGGEAVVEGLIWALRDRDCFVRKRAASALGQIGSEAAIPWLIGLFNDEEFFVRKAVTEALKQIGTEAVVMGLQHALSDRDTGVRKRTVWILGQIGSESAINGLLDALNDKHSQVREQAASALGKIGSKVGNTEIRQVLQDKGFTVPMSAFSMRKKDTDEVVHTQLMQDSVVLASSAQQEQAALGSNTIPKIFITSCNEASEHLFCTTRGPLIKHLISIGSPGEKPPQGYSQVSHVLRLEFDDITAPDDDPEYVLPTAEDIRKVIDFVPLIAQDGGNLLIHCQAGISRSSAVALTICAVLLGAGKEEEALAMVLAARPQAVPNRWIVELADEALRREGKLVEVVQRFHDSLWEGFYEDSEDGESL